MDGQFVSIQDAFRSYNSLTDSIADHSALLESLPRYAAAFQVTSDPVQFAQRIAAGGYSFSPEYAAKLAQILTAYNLYEYDCWQASRWRVSHPLALAPETRRPGVATSPAPAFRVNSLGAQEALPVIGMVTMAVWPVTVECAYAYSVLPPTGVFGNCSVTL